MMEVKISCDDGGPRGVVRHVEPIHSGVVFVIIDVDNEARLSAHGNFDSHDVASGTVFAFDLLDTYHKVLPPREVQPLKPRGRQS